jgi:hypothetical protein
MRSTRWAVALSVMSAAATMAVLPASVASASTHHGSKHPKGHHGSNRNKDHHASTSGSTVSETCPTAAVISAALGSTYPAPQSSTGAGMVSCSYNNPNTSANAVLGFSKATGITAAVLKSTAQSQAQAQHVAARPVAGLGDAAYIFTLTDASTNSSGVATTVLLIKSGSTLVDITAEASPAQAEALGHVLVK